MLSLIARNWRGAKERLALLVVGAVVISVGLTYVVALAQTSKGTVQQLLEERWRSSYDLMVRPASTPSAAERHLDLVEPNYLLGLPGEISLDQYEIIKGIPGVEVAAPVAVVGWVNLTLPMDFPLVTDPGVYRMTRTVGASDGRTDYRTTEVTYWLNSEGPAVKRFVKREGRVVFAGLPEDYGMQLLPQNLRGSNENWNWYGQLVLLVGIDPEQEARLVGLDGAVVSGRYFSAADVVRGEQVESRVPAGAGGGSFTRQIWTTPVLVSRQAYADTSFRFQLQKLDLDYRDELAMLEQVRARGGRRYLDGLPIQATVADYRLGAQDLRESLYRYLDEISGGRRRPVYPSQVAALPGPVEYHPADSPFPSRWPLCYRVVPEEVGFLKGIFRGVGLEVPMYRAVQSALPADPSLNKDPYLELSPIGFFDPNRLRLAHDPLNELPMETYRPAAASLVLDAGGRPVNPPVEIRPVESPGWFLTSPPAVLTTLEAAAKLKANPISAIRVRIAGSETTGETAQARAEAVAREIRDRTGLAVDIMLGSSPRRVLIHVCGSEEIPDLGYVEQPWIQKGAALTILRETRLGFSVIVGAVLVVAVLYVLSTTSVSVLLRLREFGILSAVGWRPGRVLFLILGESLLTGVLVGAAGVALAWAVASGSRMTLSPLRLAAVALLPPLVYGAGATLPARTATRVHPRLAVGEGEVGGGSLRLAGGSAANLVLADLVRRWKRNVLCVLSMALPILLLTVFLYVTVRLRGVMYTTWLGEYVALEVGPSHYFAAVFALFMAVLTTTDITWLNVSQRRAEMALLQALGWRNWQVRGLVLAQGVVLGWLAGLLGLAGGTLALALAYHAVPPLGVEVVLAILGLSTLTGLAGAVVPAWAATRGNLAAALRRE